MKKGSEPRSAPAPTGLPWRRGLQVALLVLAAIVIYSPAFHGGWLWDDNEDIPHNALFKDPRALFHIWISPRTLDYYPLKTTLQLLQWQAWGDNTLGYHLTNVALHVLCGLLLWRVLRQLGVRLAWLGALLFVVHPVAVESVAWITEFKNSVSLAPLLLAVSCYLRYDASRDAAAPDRGAYLKSLLWFLVAMLCKSSVVMFPVSLLLFAWWRRNRISVRDLWDSVPFFGISGVLGYVAVWLQQHRSIAGMTETIGGVALRSAIAGRALLFYLVHCLVPLNLTPLYPRWVVSGSLIDFWPWAVLLAAAVWFWRRRSGWGRAALFGVGWFAINAAPTLGFLTVSTMRFTWVMDHFIYVSLVGWAGLAAVAAGALEKRLGAQARPWAAAAAGLICVVFALEGRAYAGAYKSEGALWTYAAKEHPDSWTAQNNVGAVLLGEGNRAQAKADFTEALRLHQNYADAHRNLAKVLILEGNFAEAAVHYAAALKYGPEDAETRESLGFALVQTGHAAEAVPQFEASLRLNPLNSETEDDLGAALAQSGHVPEAVPHFARAVQLDPLSARAHCNLGAAYVQQGHKPEGEAQLREALRLDPNFSAARQLLGQ